MSKDTQVDQLIINTLTKEQYNQITPLENQLYFITNDSGSVIQGNGFNLFDIVMKDHILDFEESEGFGSFGTYVYKDAVAGSRYGYPDFYAKCLEEYQDINNTTETISNVTITINANGHKFYDIADKAAIDTIYNSTGEAWFYGIDTTNERVFLPRSTRFKNAQSASEVGEYQEAGLPNITGNFNATNQSRASSSGATGDAIYVKNSTGAVSAANSGGVDAWYQLDASRSSSIYGNSDTVEYSSTKLIPYIVVGNTAQTKAIIDVTDITTSENDTLPLFTGMYFDYNPNNVGWLLGGEQVNSGSIYITAYNELVNELTLPKYNLKVIEEEDMVSGTDYSEYWIVNQTQQYFICPTKLSYDALSGSEIPAYGNGITLGLTDGNGRYGGINQGSSANSINLNSDYGSTMPSTNSLASNFNPGYVLGLTTDPTKSGIVTNLNSAKSSTAKLYFKVANAVENLELLDAGEVMEVLSGKVSTSDLSEIYPVVETYSNGTSWYRVYSDGWCEQGGYLTGYSGWQTIPVTFLKPFMDTNYNVTACHTRRTGSAYNDYSVTGIINPTTTGMSLNYYGTDTTGTIWWRVAGYIA